MKKIICLAVFVSAQALAAGGPGSTSAGAGAPITDDSVVMKWRGSMDTPLGQVQQAVKALAQLRADVRAGKVSNNEQASRLARIKAVFDYYGYVMPNEYSALPEIQGERRLASKDDHHARVRVVPAN